MSLRPSHTSISLVPGPDCRAISDGDLARALKDGYAWALHETWRRFAPMVSVMAARAMGSNTESEDLTQEVFYRVFRKTKTIREPDSLRSFVYSFAIRVLKTELRRKRTRGWLSFHRSETLEDIGHATVDVESRDLLRRFYGLLDRLTTRDRLVFVLRHLERMTVEEIAARMDISLSTVKRSLLHANDKLARWVETDLGLPGFLGADP
ncbi:MAG TPA: sigma-70 family RNA polymerase sigma factor [Polyangia bacterium]